MHDWQVFFGVIEQLLNFNVAEIKKHQWAIFQAYGFFILIVFLVVVLYAYWFHLYKSEAKGERDYEKYAHLALKDEIDDGILEHKRSA